MQKPEIFMQRCLQLAEKGSGRVAPNPMVGAVLVYKDNIIGEGYHHYFGGPHAEVDCLKNVIPENKKYISQSTLYVSLEPCCFEGKTPACTNLILQHKIPQVVIACRDPNSKVDGAGIEILEKQGVKIRFGILEKEAQELNKWFFTFQTKNRPYVILKWAQSANGKIAAKNYIPVKISNDYTNRLVHKWRSEIPSILVGGNTVLADNPSLNNRYWTGINPIRIVIDKSLQLDKQAKIFEAGEAVYIFNFLKEEVKEQLHYIKIKEEIPLLPQVLEALYKSSIAAVLVEGGMKTLQSFLDAGLWDEARIITNTNKIIEGGITAPVFNFSETKENINIKDDALKFYYNSSAQ